MNRGLTGDDKGSLNAVGACGSSLSSSLYNEGMLTAEARRNLAVVLVGARNPQNIGAAARAMQDFGFTDLRVVNEFSPPFEAAQLEAKSAVGAADVMRSARLFAGLRDAIEDRHVIFGTTAIGGRDVSRPILTLQAGAPLLLSSLSPAATKSSAETSGTASPATSRSRVALLFGSEKTGLSNEQLSFCHQLLTIPMFSAPGRHLSMNLGQSVAVCLYELTRAGFEGARKFANPEPIPSTLEDRERLLSLLLEVMQGSDYARRFPANARTPVVRRLVRNLAATKDDATTWMGILKLVLRGLSRGTKIADL